MLNELVVLHHNEPMTTSMAIAEGVGMEHHSVLVLLKKHIEPLSEFGRVEFEIQPFETNGGRQWRDVYFLNEQQATLLITFMRNSEIVIRFKVALVKAFFAMRDQLRSQTPQFTTRQLDHGADLAVAADRTFRSFMRAARSAGMSLPAALRIANVKTVERTGLDMLAELNVDPDGVAVASAKFIDTPADPFVDALTQWSDAKAVGGQFCMSEILSEVCGIRFGSKAFERQSPAAGRVLRRLGWRVRSTRIDGFVRRRWEKHIN